MILRENLLLSEEQFTTNSILNGTNVKGSYSTMQFVLRLRDDIREVLDKGGDDFEVIQASSTKIHENIHWWQHVGSNFGFLYSLAFPAIAHITSENLKNIIKQDLKYKSITKFEEKYYSENGKADIYDINIIVNNYRDIEYAKSFSLNNKNIDDIQKDQRFFLSIGHCYHIFWNSTLTVIASTIDSEYTFLPNPDKWLSKFIDLERRQINGFYVGCPTPVSPIGIKAIYEGQAVFNQIQFLCGASGLNYVYDDFIRSGMLHGIYTEAFELYLKILNIEKPIDLHGPCVGLFLLLCDISINPNNGYPLDIYDYEKFIEKNDPGIRFTLLCKNIAENTEHYLAQVKSYSKEEYINLSKELSESIGCRCSYESIKSVLDWSEKGNVTDILKEEDIFKFSLNNLPIRLMFSKYFRFQEDKYLNPNIFCWFGYHAGKKDFNIEFDDLNSLYKKHHALFQDDYDGEIKASMFDNKDKENILESFNNFYTYNILYDLILKWIDEEGPFSFDYKWLLNTRKDDAITSIKANFERFFGISCDDIEIL